MYRLSRLRFERAAAAGAEPAHEAAADRRRTARRLALAGLVVARRADRPKIIIGRDALEQRREHVVRHISDQADVVILEEAEEGVGPGHLFCPGQVPCGRAIFYDRHDNEPGQGLGLGRKLSAGAGRRCYKKMEDAVERSNRVWRTLATPA